MGPWKIQHAVAVQHLLYYEIFGQTLENAQKKTGASKLLEGGGVSEFQSFSIKTKQKTVSF